MTIENVSVLDDWTPNHPLLSYIMHDLITVLKVPQNDVPSCLIIHCDLESNLTLQHSKLLSLVWVTDMCTYVSVIYGAWEHNNAIIWSEKLSFK
jgi:hypothetical protein